MPEPEPLFVDFEALNLRAEELREPLRDPPTTTPKAPCSLDLVADSAINLKWSVEAIREQLKNFAVEQQRLRIAVKNVAQTYRMIDNSGAQAISDDKSASGSGGMAMLGSVAHDSDSAMLGGAQLGALGDDHPVPPTPGIFLDVETRAKQLEDGDGGKSFLAVNTEWTNYANLLQDARRRFRRFTDDEWRGRWKDEVNNAFDQQSQWLDDMAETCRTMARAAKDAANAHAIAIRDHVWGTYSNMGKRQYDYAALRKVEENWKQDAWTGYDGFMKFFQELQANSDAVWAKYQSSGHLPIQRVRVPAVVKAIKIPDPWNKPAKPPNWDDYEMDAKHQKNLKPAPRPDIPEPKPKPKPTPQPDGGLDGLPMMPSSPSMPSMPKDHPNPGDPNLADALASALDKGTKTPGLPHGGAGGGIKPAAAMPLQPFTDDAPRPAPAAGSGPGGPGRGVPGGVGGAMGGGMGGGAPAQGGKDGGKGKRVQGEDEALYTEEREWTEGLIGRRRVKEN